MVGGIALLGIGVEIAVFLADVIFIGLIEHLHAVVERKIILPEETDLRMKIEIGVPTPGIIGIIVAGRAVSAQFEGGVIAGVEQGQLEHFQRFLEQDAPLAVRQGAQLTELPGKFPVEQPNHGFLCAGKPVEIDLQQLPGEGLATVRALGDRQFGQEATHFQIIDITVHPMERREGFLAPGSSQEQQQQQAGGSDTNAHNESPVYH